MTADYAFDDEDDDQTIDPKVGKYEAWLNKQSKKHDAHWSEWRTETETCYDVVAGRAWDKDAKAEWDEALNKVAAEFNRVDPVISAVSGAEIQNRQEVKFYPREMSEKDPQTGEFIDAASDETLTAAVDWVRDECDAPDEESDSFWDCLVCGLGWVEQRMDFTNDQEGMPIIERIDSLEVTAFPATKKNCMDAKSIRRRKPFDCDDANEMFPGYDFKGDDKDGRPSPHVNSPGADAYDDAPKQTKAASDEVIIDEWQWWELDKIHLVAPPGEMQPQYVDHETFEKMDAYARKAGQPLQSATIPLKRYYRAYMKGGALLKFTPEGSNEPVYYEEILAGKDPLKPQGEFTLKCITGKRDRNRGTWYGLVRPMIDPQRWSNKFWSQILHIVNVGAKGGVMFEEDAVDDVRDFEDNWARSDAATMVNTGALSNGKIQPKPIAGYPPALDRLFMTATQGIQDVTGIPKEMLGQVDREQAGVTEFQRKQTAYAMLAPFFDSLKRYRRLSGKLTVKLINNFMSDQTLIRVVGKDSGAIRYLPLIRQSDNVKYDAIVDEAPSGPHQKERIWAAATQFMPLLKDAGPEIMAELVKYSPLPQSLSSKIAQTLLKPNPAAQAQQQLMQAKEQGEIGKTQAETGKIVAETQQTQVETALIPAEFAAGQEAEAQVRVNI